MYIAVYGTLKRGFRNHELLDPRGFRFVGFFTSVDKMHMTSAGGFPIVYKWPETHHVMAEVYEVLDEACLSRLDELEGHPFWYRREERFFLPLDEEIRAQCDPITAQVYLMERAPPNSRYNNVRVTRDVAQWVKAVD